MMKIIPMATPSSTPADFSEEDVERHRRMARMGRNEALSAPHFVSSWTVTGSGGSKGKIRATSMAEKNFNGQRTEAEAAADVIEQVSTHYG